MIVPARLEWAADGTPRSSSYDDVYHSTKGGLEQTQHVFLSGNALPERWRARHLFTVLETGFGLGLNFLATWQAWRADPQRCERLHFISTELHPFTRADLATLHASWPELTELAQQLQTAWPPLTPGFHHLLLDEGRVTLTLLFGDANDTLKQLVGKVDAIYLDGFSPQKNPQLWSSDLLALLTEHAAPDATLASWCVAGEIRSALKAQGWTLKKRPGFAHKWQMLTGKRSEMPVPPKYAAQTAIVVGAGIAGCSIAEALARRGYEVTLIERQTEPAPEASGNPAGLLHPMLAKDDNLAARFSRAAYLYSLRLLQKLGHNELPWQASGILQIAEDADDEVMQQISCKDFPADYVSWLDRASASKQAGLAVSAGGWWFPQGAWVSPPAFCRALLRASGKQLHTRYNCTVASLHYEDGQWHAKDANGHGIATAEHLILANATAANALLPELTLTLRGIRGQLSYLPGQTFEGLKTALCGVGYAIRTDSSTNVIGASFIEDDTATELRPSEHADNLSKLARLLPELSLQQIDSEKLPGRASFRAASHDRMPLVGTLPQAQLKEQHTLANLPRQAGLHALLGLGARGLSWGPMAAELLAAEINGECLPLERSISQALDPARFHLRKIRREANR
jgi:tRNA 5-methylaminomethyl-2-thiouridine biosynthesis bifunctional protein